MLDDDVLKAFIWEENLILSRMELYTATGRVYIVNYIRLSYKGAFYYIFL